MTKVYSCTFTMNNARGTFACSFIGTLHAYYDGLYYDLGIMLLLVTKFIIGYLLILFRYPLRPTRHGIRSTWTTLVADACSCPTLPVSAGGVGPRAHHPIHDHLRRLKLSVVD